MRFIRFHTVHQAVPIYVARDAIAVVAEGMMHDDSKRREVRTGKADLLVHGEWIQVDQSPADVMRMLGEPA